MLGESGLDKLEREMISAAVSAVNHCHYFPTAPLSGNAPAILQWVKSLPKLIALRILAHDGRRCSISQ